jgi:hypothetical protein
MAMLILTQLALGAIVSGALIGLILWIQHLASK